MTVVNERFHLECWKIHEEKCNPPYFTLECCERVARKQYECEECGKPILKGEKHVSMSTPITEFC